LSREGWRVRQQATQPVHVTVVEQIDGLPESAIGDPLVMRLLEVRGVLIADERAQACPTRESKFPGDGQLAVAQGKRRCFD